MGDGKGVSRPISVADREESETQEVELKIDPGSKTTGGATPIIDLQVDAPVPVVASLVRKAGSERGYRICGSR
jgi:hypothetical protein